MLSIDAARKIGINACIDWLGREFVMAHSEFATSAFGEIEDGIYCFVGVDDCKKPNESSDRLSLDSQSSFPYRASCNVSLSSGVPVFIECVKP